MPYNQSMKFLITLLLLLPVAAVAQDRRPSHCISLVGAPELQVVPVTFRQPLDGETVRITYIDHAMFLIQAGDVSAVTDFSGWIGNVDFWPDAVTMNNAHSSHWTGVPDPAIPNVLEGWANDDGPRDHHLDLGDMLIRNVHTDTRGFNEVRRNGNSIFVFEAAGLCIGHLGHLHHMPTPEQMAALGRLDVVMAAVDGGLTVDHETLVALLARLRSSVVIPMHWFGRSTLEQFIAEMPPGFAVDRSGSNTIEISLRTLPDVPTVLVLEPQFLSDE